MFTISLETSIARDEYLELRIVLDMDEHLFAAREAFVGGKDASRASRELDAAQQRLVEFRLFQSTQHHDKTMHEEYEDELLTLLERDLQLTREGFSRAGAPLEADIASVLVVLDGAQAHLRQLATEMDERIAHAQLTSDRTIRKMLAVLGSACLLILIVTAALNIALYRSIVVPLERLAVGVRRIAAGRFDERVDVLPQGEFADVARDFNQMASKLEELYDTLEMRVRDKSRELVRSERLAVLSRAEGPVA